MTAGSLFITPLSFPSIGAPMRALAFVIAQLALATCGPDSLAEHWRGRWIAASDPPGINQWFAYRKTFSYGGDETTPVEAKIACDSKYWLWLNGELVVFEGQLKRGPKPGASYFDRIHLTGKLRTGENTLAALVWRFGKEGMSHSDPGTPGLVFEAAASGSPFLVSDASWRVLRHPAYYTTEQPHPNWRLPESNVAFDARRDLEGWTASSHDDSDWPHAIERGVPPDGPWGELVERPVPMWTDSGLRDYVAPPHFPKVAADEPVVGELPYNAQVTPYMAVDAPAGLVIGIRTDNYRGGGEPNVRAEYVTREGVQEYESLGWMSGHRVVYDVPKGVKVLALKYRESGYDTELTGEFRCSDERLNTLWRKAQRTLYVNLRDTYFDCPDRERAQWWGDVTLEMQQAFYALDRRTDRLSRKAILELAAWRRPGGELFSPVPAGNWDKELPLQMLASVGRYGFWEYYRHTGDRRLLEQVYPAVNDYLSLWRVGPEGLVVPRAGGWTWGDWGDNIDMPLLDNAWCFLAIDGRRRMAEVLGDGDQAAQDAVALEALKASFNQAFWTDAGYRSPGHTGPLDDRGNGLAVVAGLADPSRHPVLKEVLTRERHASPYMEKYVLEALFQIGETNTALDRMLDRYRPMIDSPLTTLWEGWGIGPNGYGGGSYNHAWSGGVLTLLSQYVAGIDPATPGYSSVRVRPQIGRLDWVETAIVTPRGPVRYKVAKGKPLEFDLPPGVSVLEGAGLPPLTPRGIAE